MLKVSTGLSSTISTINSASTSSAKIPDTAVPAKIVPRVKLPVGVVPIPEMIVPKIDKEDSKRIDVDRNLSEAKRNNHEVNRDGVKSADNDGREGIGGRHIGEQILERQDNPAWYKVKPGVQEIGDEPNNLRRIIPE